MDVVEPWRACCDRPTRYERSEWNHRRTGPIQNDLTSKQNYNSKTVDDSPNRNPTWRKTDMNFEEKKTTYDKWLKIPTPVVEKFEVEIETIKYGAGETSSKNLKVSGESSTRSTSDSIVQWLWLTGEATAAKRPYGPQQLSTQTSSTYGQVRSAAVSDLQTVSAESSRLRWHQGLVNTHSRCRSLFYSRTQCSHLCYISLNRPILFCLCIQCVSYLANFVTLFENYLQGGPAKVGPTYIFDGNICEHR